MTMLPTSMSSGCSIFCDDARKVRELIDRKPGDGS
jgi:hypothetical protein